MSLTHKKLEKRAQDLSECSTHKPVENKTISEPQVSVREYNREREREHNLNPKSMKKSTTHKGLVKRAQGLKGIQIGHVKGTPQNAFTPKC